MSVNGSASSGDRASSVRAGGVPWLFFAALVAVWGGLFFILTGEWEANEQYSHGWFIPLLAGWIFWQRWATRPAPRPAEGGMRWACGALLVLLAAPAALGILITGAYPDWRLVLWTLGISAVVASVALTALAGGWPWVRHLSFACIFALVAVPWPSGPEQWLTQELSLVAARIASWILPLMGIAAMCHGTTIDVGSDVLGVDDACSGIRSFQSSLMAALFLGELYRLRWGVRLALCAVSLLIAYGLNVTRMLILSAAVAQGGMEVLDKLHDPAGFLILVVTMAVLWLLCWALQKAPALVQPQGASVTPGDAGTVRGAVAAAVVLAAVVLMAAGTEVWYVWKSRGVERAPAWTIASAPADGAVADEPLGPKVEEMLRYDRGFQRTWHDDEGRTWHMIFTEWEPKRMSLHYAQPHLPEQCQRMIGREIVSKSELRRAEANGVSIAYNIYKIRSGTGEFCLMYVVNDDRIAGEEIAVTRATVSNRLAAVLAGRRNMGQRSMQLALVAEADEAEAEAAMISVLPDLIVPREDAAP